MTRAGLSSSAAEIMAQAATLLTNKRKSRTLDLCATWQETRARNFGNIRDFAKGGATEACLLAELAAKFKS